jgi:hypothetical protein
MNRFILLTLSVIIGLTTTSAIAQNEQPKSNKKTSNPSINSCEQFLTAFKQRYRYAYAYPEVSCNSTTANSSTFEITTHNFTHFYYQPRTETVLRDPVQGDTELLRVSDFINVNQANDMNGQGELYLYNLPKEQRLKVCGLINSVGKNIILGNDFSVAAGYAVKTIAENGNWDFKVVKTGDTCRLQIMVSGNYEGNSYNKSISCSIGELIKKGGFFVPISFDYRTNACY